MVKVSDYVANFDQKCFFRNLLPEIFQKLLFSTLDSALEGYMGTGDKTSVTLYYHLKAKLRVVETLRDAPLR